LSTRCYADFLGGSDTGVRLSQDVSFSQAVEEEVTWQQEQGAAAPAAKRPCLDLPGLPSSVRAIFEIDHVALVQNVATDIRPAQEGNILHELAHVRAAVRSSPAAEGWSASFRHLLEGAIAVHRLRLLDISRREEVFFLELIEGNGQHIRAHQGQCFFFNEHGYWAVYNGVVPQGTLARCKKFLLQLEGFYKLLPDSTVRTPDGIVQAASLLVQRHGGDPDALLGRCERDAICSAGAGGQGQGRQRQARAAAEEEIEQPEVFEGGSWTARMASTIGKLYVKLPLGLCQQRMNLRVSVAR
jgi:hypothetical protein